MKNFAVFGYWESKYSWELPGSKFIVSMGISVRDAISKALECLAEMYLESEVQKMWFTVAEFTDGKYQNITASNGNVFVKLITRSVHNSCTACGERLSWNLRTIGFCPECYVETHFGEVPMVTSSKRRTSWKNRAPRQRWAMAKIAMED